MLEGLQIFFGTQAVFLKDLVAAMQNKKYKRETITGRFDLERGTKKAAGGVTVSNKDIDAMEALFASRRQGRAAGSERPWYTHSY